TLYEAYPMTSYFFDTNRLGPNDALHITLNGIASLVMFLTAAIIRGAIVLVWTMFDQQVLTSLGDSITDNISATAEELSGWLLPTALAVGALVAYAKTRGTQGGGLSQLAWVVAAGVLA